MNKKPENPSAFPYIETVYAVENGNPRNSFKVGETQRLGMTLRDFFAAAALQGMMGRDDYHPGLATPAQRATVAYIEADAMLEARNA